MKACMIKMEKFSCETKDQAAKTLPNLNIDLLKLVHKKDSDLD
jgi:hypothetical protein